MFIAHVALIRTIHNDMDVFLQDGYREAGLTKHTNARKYSRAQVAVTAILTPSGGEPIDVDVIDISMGGMFVRADEILAPGTRCQITILLGHFKHELPIGADGVVIRSNEDGIALKFGSVKIETAPELQSLIVFNADDPHEAAVEFSKHGGWIFNPESDA